MKTGLIIAVIAMVAVGIWFVVDYLAPGSPSWVVFIFAAAAMLAVGGMGTRRRTSSRLKPNSMYDNGV